jgi:hypothetical protein
MAVDRRSVNPQPIRRSADGSQTRNLISGAQLCPFIHIRHALFTRIKCALSLIVINIYSYHLWRNRQP